MKPQKSATVVTVPVAVEQLDVTHAVGCPALLSCEAVAAARLSYDRDAGAYSVQDWWIEELRDLSLCCDADFSGEISDKPLSKDIAALVLGAPWSPTVNDHLDGTYETCGLSRRTVLEGLVMEHVAVDVVERAPLAGEEEWDAAEEAAQMSRGEARGW